MLGGVGSIQCCAIQATHTRLRFIEPGGNLLVFGLHYGVGIKMVSHPPVATMCRVFPTLVVTPTVSNYREANMLQLKSVVLAAYAATAVAVDITVKATGGNATSGHQYGFLHEVRLSSSASFLYP